MMVHRQDGKNIKYKIRDKVKNTTVHNLPFKNNKQTSNIIMEKTKRFSAALWLKANFFL